MSVDRLTLMPSIKYTCGVRSCARKRVSGDRSSGWGRCSPFNNCTASINAGKTCFNNGQALLLTWAVCAFNPWFIFPRSGAQGPCQAYTGLQRVATLGRQVLHKTPGTRWSPEPLEETGHDGVLSLRGVRVICERLFASFCHKHVECGTGDE